MVYVIIYKAKYQLKVVVNRICDNKKDMIYRYNIRVGSSKTFSCTSVKIYLKKYPYRRIISVNSDDLVYMFYKKTYGRSQI